MHSETAGLTRDERGDRPRAAMSRMPSDWQLATVGDLFHVQQGKAISPGARSGPDPRPFLRTANVLWGRLALSHLDEMSFSPEEAERLALLPDDLLVCEGGEIGRTAIWSGEVAGCLIQNHVHRLRASTIRVVPRFIMHWLRAAFLHLGVYEGVGNKTTIPNLSAARVKQLPIPLPSRAEQLGIASVLDHLDRRCQLEESRLASLRTLKAATMAKVFMSGVRGKPVRDSLLGAQPADWRVRSLGDVSVRSDYGTSVRCTYGDSGLPVLRIPNVVRGQVDGADLKFGTVDARSAERLQLEDGDVLFVRTNGSRELIGRSAVYRGSPAGALFASYLIRFRLAQDGLLPGFLQAFLESQGRRQVLALARESSDGKFNIDASRLKQLLIPTPSLGEQEEISRISNALTSSIHVAESALRHQADLFSKTLHSLMEGEIRLVSAEIASRTDAS